MNKQTITVAWKKQLLPTGDLSYLQITQEGVGLVQLTKEQTVALVKLLKRSLQEETI